MKIEKVSVNISKTIQVAPYEPVNVAVGYEASIGETDDPNLVTAALEDLCKSEINRIFTPILEKSKKK